MTLSKLKGTVEYIQTVMVDSGEDSLEDRISVAFHNRAPELDCDVVSAAYVLDQQFINPYTVSRYSGFTWVISYFLT